MILLFVILKEINIIFSLQYQIYNKILKEL